MKHTTSHTQSSRSCSLVVQHSFLVIRQLAGSHGSPSYRITVKLLYYALLVHKEKSKTQSITATKLAPPHPQPPTPTSHLLHSFPFSLVSDLLCNPTVPLIPALLSPSSFTGFSKSFFTRVNAVIIPSCTQRKWGSESWYILPKDAACFYWFS